MRLPLLLPLLFLTLPASSHASLGAPSASVELDRKAVGGNTRVTPKQGYSVHEIAAGKNRIREFVGADDQVFAVTWQGPTRPDLSQLLGSYYGQYHTARAAAPHRLRGVRNTVSENLIVQESGHLRDVRGKAYLPGQLPRGVRISQVR